MAKARRSRSRRPRWRLSIDELPLWMRKDLMARAGGSARRRPVGIAGADLYPPIPIPVEVTADRLWRALPDALDAVLSAVHDRELEFDMVRGRRNMLRLTTKLVREELKGHPDHPPGKQCALRATKSTPSKQRVDALCDYLAGYSPQDIRERLGWPKSHQQVFLDRVIDPIRWAVRTAVEGKKPRFPRPQ